MNNFETEWQRFSEEAKIKSKKNMINVVFLIGLVAIAATSWSLYFKFDYTLLSMLPLVFALSTVLFYICLLTLRVAKISVMEVLDDADYIPALLKKEANTIRRDCNLSFWDRLHSLFMATTREELEDKERKEDEELFSNMPWRQVVRVRLISALGELKQVPGYSHYTPSLLAEKAGFDSPVDVLAAFEGDKDLSFDQLDRLAYQLGVNPAYLKHGEPSLYPIGREVRLPGIVSEAIDALFEPEPSTGALVKRLHFFRANNDRGCLVIVRIFTTDGFDVWQTPYVLSDQIGNTGERDQVFLCELLESLYARYTAHDLPAAPGLIIRSFLADPALLGGQIGFQCHPLRWSRVSLESAWWEDLWDDGAPSAQVEHWDGMKALRSSILARASVGVS